MSKNTMERALFTSAIVPSAFTSPVQDQRNILLLLLLLLFTFNSRLEAHAIIYNEKNDIADKK